MPHAAIVRTAIRMVERGNEREICCTNGSQGSPKHDPTGGTRLEGLQVSTGSNGRHLRRFLHGCWSQVVIGYEDTQEDLEGLSPTVADRMYSKIAESRLFPAILAHFESINDRTAAV